MKFIVVTLFILTLCVCQIQAQTRKEIDIPDIPGYLTLKCDFHLSTVFPDGEVWPTNRVIEAWEEGLDAISITDHIEYQPHVSDVNSDHNRSYEIAKPLADQYGIILIRGAELTFKMPPGNLNAIFIKNANLLVRNNWMEACQEAKDQGAFVFWSPPTGKYQEPEKIRWGSQLTPLLGAGILGGIEVYNNKEYYPEAYKWSKEKGLTMLANSDAQASIQDYDLETTHRPITLVFATERKVESIRYALQNHRTAIYFENKLIGNREFLEPIFYATLQIRNKFLQLENNESKYLQIHNNSDIDYVLYSNKTSVGYSYQKEVVLKAHRTTLVEITGNSDEIKKQPVLKLEYEVTNLMVAPDEKLKVIISADNL